MSRIWSTEAEPHRALALYDDPQRGEDVRALQVACKKRLAARGISRDFNVDGIFGPKTKAAFDTAAWYLGALKETVDSDEFTVGAQVLVRYPGRRNGDQLERAADRTEQLRRDRDAADKRKGAPVSGVGGSRATEGRNIMIASFDLLYRHRDAVGYTQGPARWEGIAKRLVAAQGDYPRNADCSSAFTWCGWNAARHLGLSDVFNGASFTGGYTGTLLLHGRALDAPVRGCAVIYGQRWPGVHVAMYDEDGKVYSHGSPPGPYYLDMHYRSDILAFRQYI